MSRSVAAGLGILYLVFVIGGLIFFSKSSGKPISKFVENIDTMATIPNSVGFSRDKQFTSNFKSMETMMQTYKQLYFGEKCGEHCKAFEDARCDVYCNFGNIIHLPQTTGTWGREFVQTYGSSWKIAVVNTVGGGKGVSKTNPTLQYLEKFCNSCNTNTSPRFPSSYFSS